MVQLNLPLGKAILSLNMNTHKGHKTKCNKMEDDRKRLYTLIFNQLGRN